MNDQVQQLVASGNLSPEDGEKLSKLEAGTYCNHKSWGPGRVAAWDLIADRISVDFEGKPGHSMKLSFALGTLEVLPDEHILSQRVADSDALKQRAMDDPAGLVEEAIQGAGGSLFLNDLDALLKGSVIEEGAYKKWWEAAKRQLKTRRHIVVPSKRTEPLTIRELGGQVGETMANAFISQRGLKGKIKALATISKDLDLIEEPNKDLKPVFQDITDTVRKAWRLHLPECLQLVLTRDDLVDAIEGGELPMGSLKIEDLISEAKPLLAEAVGGLPVGLLGRMYRSFPAAFPDGVWVTEILEHLTRTGGRAVSEIATVMDANNELPVLTEFLKKSVRNRRFSVDLLIWACNEREGLAKPVFDLDLGNAILSALEDDHIQGGPKKTGRLGDLLSKDQGLIPGMVEGADADEVKNFAKRVLACQAFDELTRRSLMARIIKARPETSSLMEDNSGSKDDETLIVSWSSLARRKKELDEINTVKIPQNKKDIQIAREYGDLRENFEYKSAKQQQAVLNKMQTTLESELRNARGTDFANTPTDKVGIGTVVDIEDVDSGEKETYTILGAWDGDVDKNIISYLSESAKALIGHAEGDVVDLPSDSTAGTRKVKVNGISACPIDTEAPEDS